MQVYQSNTGHRKSSELFFSPWVRQGKKKCWNFFLCPVVLWFVLLLGLLARMMLLRTECVMRCGDDGHKGDDDDEKDHGDADGDDDGDDDDDDDDDDEDDNDGGDVDEDVW